jgi:hypothetical protein
VAKRKRASLGERIPLMPYAPITLGLLNVFSTRPTFRTATWRRLVLDRLTC